MPPFGCAPDRLEQHPRPARRHHDVVVAERDVVALGHLEALVHAGGEPPVLRVGDHPVGRAARVAGRLPLRAVVHDDQLVGHVGVRADRLDHPPGVGHPVPLERDDRQLGVRVGLRPPPDRGRRRVGHHAVEHLGEVVGAVLPVELAGDELERVRPPVGCPGPGRRARDAARRPSPTASLGGTTSAVSPSCAYSRLPPLSVVTSGTPDAMASSAGCPNPSNQLPTANTSAAAYSRASAACVRSFAERPDDGTPRIRPASSTVAVPFHARTWSPVHRMRCRFGRSCGWKVSRLTPPSTTTGRWPVASATWSAVQPLLASWRSTGADQAVAAARLPVDRVEHAPAGRREAVDHVPLALVVEADDVQLVGEALGHRSDAGPQRHPPCTWAARSAGT